MLAGLVCAQTFLVDFTRKYLLIENRSIDYQAPSRVSHVKIKFD